ncbi:MAG: hypothetical protein ACTSXZ_05640, partial [Alphaproteobacteria bacterium]
DTDALVMWRNTSPAIDQLVADPARQARAFAFPAAQAANSALAFLPWYFTKGGSLIQQGILNLDVDATVAALSIMKQRVGDEQDQKALAAMEQADVFSCLAGGNCLATLGGSWERGMLVRQSKLSTQIVSQPFALGEQPGTTLVGGWSFVLFNHDGAKIIDFLATLFHADVQRAKLHQHSLLPVHLAALDDEWFNENPDGATFKTSLQIGRSLPLHAGTLAALDHLATMVAEVFLGKKTPQQAAQDAAEKIARQAPVEAPAAIPDVPPGSVRIIAPDGADTLLNADDLQKFELASLGDLRVIPVRAFCPDCGNSMCVVTAADGYTKTVAATQISSAYLEPAHLRLILHRGGGQTFTVRDVVEIKFVAAEESALTIQIGEREQTIETAQLQKLAREGMVPFAELLAQFGEPPAGVSTVRVIARDGYQREIPWDDFRQGQLRLAGMRCEFAGRSSKDQVRDMARIEAP